jgi:hypothetical protein
MRRGRPSIREGKLDGPLTRERAGVFLALGAGMRAMRQMMEVPALAGVDPGELEAS